MELKTKIIAGEGKQDLVITREFDLPVELLFTAYTEAGIVEQWMGTKVLKLENKKHGCYQFETTDPKETNTHSTEPSTRSVPIKKSSALLNLKTCLLVFNWKAWNLNRLRKTAAN